MKNKLYIFNKLVAALHYDYTYKNKIQNRGEFINIANILTIQKNKHFF